MRVSVWVEVNMCIIIVFPFAPIPSASGFGKYQLLSSCSEYLQMERFCKLGLGCFQRRSFWRSDFFMTTGKVIGHYSFKQKQMFPSKWWWFGWLESSKHQQFKLFKLRGAIVQYPGLTGILGGKEPASQCMEPKWGPVFWQIWRIKWLEGQPLQKKRSIVGF